MEEQTKKHGRPRLSESERKKRKAARGQEFAKTRVCLGSELERWMKIKVENSFKSDREVATFLIDSYMHCKDHMHTTKIHTSTSTTVAGNLSERTPSLSEVSAPDTDRKKRKQGSYLTVDQEVALKSFYSEQGWVVRKQDLSTSTLVTDSNEKEDELQNDLNTDPHKETFLTEGIRVVIKKEPPDETMHTEAGPSEVYMNVFANLNHLHDSENDHVNALDPTLEEQHIKEEFVDPDGYENVEEDDNEKDTIDVVEIKIETEEQISEYDVHPKTAEKSQEQRVIGNTGASMHVDLRRPVETKLQIEGVMCPRMSKDILEETNTECQFCDTFCNGRCQQPIHIKEEDTDNRTFSCNECGKDFVFTTKSGCTIYHGVQPGEFRYVCESCSREFMKNPHSERHKALHVRPTPYHCEKCNALFMYQTSFARHDCGDYGDYVVRVPCELCGRQFRHLKDLKDHMELHYDEEKHQ